MSKLIVKLILLVIIVCAPIIQSEMLTRYNPCIAKTNCSECIQTQSCAWCMKPDFGDKPRCFQPGRAFECPDDEIYDPENYQHIITNRQITTRKHGSSSSIVTHYGPQRFEESKNNIQYFINDPGKTRADRASDSPVTQMSPQEVELGVRAKDFPIDLYYLMDVSESAEDKAKFFNLAELLKSSLQNITSDFRIGFGTFVNKRLMPNGSTVRTNSQGPCNDCASPYGYQHILPVTTDTDRFIREVNNAANRSKTCCNNLDNLNTSGNGVNALMQAIECRHSIEWRQQSRRILVFSTDAGFDYAVDGKLEGVITPNDGFCHLSPEGFYTPSTIQDYPSISQINLKVKQNAINIIFAVTASEYNEYKKLSHNVEGSSCVVLSEDSSNVVTLVEDEYNKISSSVEMKDSSSSVVQISYFSACLGDGPLMPTNECDGLKFGDVVEFTAEILVTHCPQNDIYWKRQFQIYPVGINEALTIVLEIFCQCRCENSPMMKSPICDYHGTSVCGLCECDPYYFGRKCECATTDIGNVAHGGCRATNESLVDCNGRGSCVCGFCECERRVDPNEIIRGQFCECDNFSCERHNDVVCSGSANGVCECGVCRCFDGWSGTACERQTITDTSRRDSIDGFISRTLLLSYNNK